MIEGIIKNEIIMACMAALVINNISKFFVHWIYYKKASFERLFENGGMPSSHTAVVTSLTISVFLTEGISTVSIVTFIFAAIVIRDALGVRMETGKQAMVLNRIIRKLRLQKVPGQDDLKELVGHTPSQVVVGAIVGAAVTFIVHNIFKVMLL